MSVNKTKYFATLFVAGNLFGVFPIAGQPGVYRPHELSDWTSSIIAHPTAHMLSPLLFLIGALGGMALGWHCINHGKRWVGSLLLVGSGWNALFIPVPLVLAQLASRGHNIIGVGTDIALSLAIFGDAMFNGLMGIGLALLGNSLKASSPKLGWSGLLIGIVTTCVIAQFELTAAADLLKVAGFLWLGWWLVWGWTVGLTNIQAEA